MTQIDGSLPNLALMKLSHWHKAQGHEVHFTRQSEPDLLEQPYDRVYGSAIFKFSAPKIARFLAAWPSAMLGGTGSANTFTVEDVIGSDEYEHYDYSLYPDYEPSLGFTQRGCRLSCKFCFVPKKEGKVRSVNAIANIWRGPGHPKKLHLLDNDFFGQPECEWRARIEEVRSGGFKICLNQGINVRHITPPAAEALSSVQYRDDSFSERRIYTAWDNLKDEAVFFRGMDILEAAGIPAKHVRAYMLVGFDKNETWDRIWHRFNRMVDRGIEPFPMVFDCRDKDAGLYRDLKRFQRWVVTGLYRAVAFADYDASKKRRAATTQLALFGNAE
ncbi:radical SAM protein [Roseomonas mucosa]|uniref:radical SAM protein n=1 Tax=Roseomonas mucosa TaxID=207340 RepID=UPI002246B136|nr:radical SAM protein [Roseomonas mucosa]